MTFKELREILQKNNISEDVTILSNGGWECGATDINAIYYSASKNEIHFTQGEMYELLPNYVYDEDSLLKENEKAHDRIRLE